MVQGHKEGNVMNEFQTKSNQHTSFDPNPGTAPMDVHTALDRAMGDVPFLEMLLKQFLDDLPAQIGELKAAVQYGEAEKLQERAHALKGSAANLSVTQIASIALSLEQMGRNGDFDQCRDGISRLEQELERLEAFVAEPNWSHRDHTAEEPR